MVVHNRIKFSNQIKISNNLCDLCDHNKSVCKSIKSVQQIRVFSVCFYLKCNLPAYALQHTVYTGGYECNSV